MFTPFAFVKSAISGAFNPELVSNLYYWWDFTDTGSMTFSSGTTIATVSNKATRTSSNETLNTVDGTPYFVDTISGSRFTSTDAISNTNVAYGGQLDTLFSGSDATVIWIGNVVGYNADASSPDNNVLWAASGGELDDLRINVYNTTTAPGGYKCPTDNTVSSTYQHLLGWHDYTTPGSNYAYRTYSGSFVGVNTFLAYAAEYGTTYLSEYLARDNQGFCDPAAPTSGFRPDNYTTNRGFKVNARSRAGTTMSGDQKIQHILIYAGILTDGEVSTIYNSWFNSL